MKLVVEEPETGALICWVAGQDQNLASSDLTRTELLRATRRAAPDRLVEARAVLDVLALLTLPTAVFERASSLSPDVLRSLDALHLAAAFELGDDLEGIVTYDERMAEAARANGIVVVAPGLESQPS